MTSVAKTTLAPDVSGLVQGATADATDVTTPIENLRDYVRAGRVAVSDNDANVKPLSDALVAGTGITLTENNNGADESLTVAVSSAVATLTGSQTLTNKTLDGTNDVDLGALAQGGATSTQFLKWSGTAWAPAGVSFSVAGDTGTTQALDNGDTLTIEGGTGIATAMTADKVTLNLDINKLTVDAVVDGSTDYAAVRKADGSIVRVLLNNFPASAGAMNSFNVTDGTTSENVSNAQNVTFADGTGVDMVVSATRTITPSLNITGLTEDTSPASTSVLAIHNGTAYRRVQIANLGLGATVTHASANINNASNYTTTSTSFVDIDSTNLSLTITTHGNPVLVGFTGIAGVNTGFGFISLAIDDSVVVVDDGLSRLNGSVAFPCGFTYLATGLSAASHKFEVVWKAAGSATVTLYAGAGTANADMHPHFYVMEIS